VHDQSGQAVAAAGNNNAGFISLNPTWVTKTGAGQFGQFSYMLGNPLPQLPVWYENSLGNSSSFASMISGSALWYGYNGGNAPATATLYDTAGTMTGHLWCTQTTY
jgi:hypothetical protein